jgi:hypothetical protein
VISVGTWIVARAGRILNPDISCTSAPLRTPHLRDFPRHLPDAAASTSLYALYLTCARSLNETPLSCHSHMTMCANLNHLGLPAISNANAKSVQRHRVLRCPFSRNQISRRRQANLRSTIAFLLCARIHLLQQTAKSKTADQHTPTIKFVLGEGDPGALHAC